VLPLLLLLLQIADAIGIAPSQARSLKSGLLTAILAISICGFTIMALVLLQGLWRLTHKSLMWGECCCSCSEWTRCFFVVTCCVTYRLVS
jgi:fumarate reductase subunit D